MISRYILEAAFIFQAAKEGGTTFIHVPHNRYFSVCYEGRFLFFEERRNILIDSFGITPRFTSIEVGK
ncbi:hypothetical protein BABA_09886 [Neobacillus bataviensis LMG 21833]|uniref:Uncharacterized protein n=1 Tax=Neobacillus bataviensis LMG 21833 TaxID=1117379 RepID=K6E7S3_9BACI|nr:hypothetical protein BABA_09886 [Neobacillus bataviensis LMG 21833]